MVPVLEICAAVLRDVTVLCRGRPVRPRVREREGIRLRAHLAGQARGDLTGRLACWLSGVAVGGHGVVLVLCAVGEHCDGGDVGAVQDLGDAV